MTTETHPWDGTIDDFAVVSASGLKVKRFVTEEGANVFARSNDNASDCIHVVYGPGLRNRLAIRMEGRWYTPEAFDKARGFGATEVSP